MVVRNRSKLKKKATKKSSRRRNSRKKVTKKKKKSRKVGSNVKPFTIEPSVVKGKGTIRIGILLTYPKLEVVKEELITYFSNLRPWNKEAPKWAIKERKFRREKKVKGNHPMGKYGIPTDVAIASYIKHAYEGEDKDVVVDMILPHDISKERLARNDINFLLTYDPLEAFHTDKSEGKKLYKKVAKVLNEANNVYPPKKYQQLIYSKIEYYKYLKKNNIAIAPTLTMTANEFKKLGKKKGTEKLWGQILKEDWPRFIIKPVLGIEGIDAEFFDQEDDEDFADHLEHCMKTYPGVVVQKEIPNFGNSKKSPELRMYYVGNEYQYSACATNRTVARPTQEGGTFKVPLKNLKDKTRKILRKLPEIRMRGKKLPRLLTRIDMGYIVENKYSPFVNEVEFVPSLYSEDCAHHKNRLIDKKLGDQMVKIARIFTKSS